MPEKTERDLNDLVVFLEVVAAGSFTAAGRRLAMPTSTVSRRVSRLEEALGVRLLQRTTRKVSLTQAGETYFERGGALLSGLEEAEAILAEAQGTPKGRVRATAPLDHTVSMRLVASFLEAHPQVRVDLELTNRSLNIIEEGYDAAICAGEMATLSVVAHKLMDSSFRIVASPEYLERRGTPQDLSDLSDHECVVFGSSSTGGSWRLPSQADPIAIRGRIAVNHLDAARDAALAHLGVALLPEMTCAGDIASGRLRVLLPDVAMQPVPVWITHAADRFLTPAVRAFVDHARANFARLARE